MSDETQSTPPAEPYDFADDPDGFTREDFTSTDPLLDFLLALVPGRKDFDVAIGLTVSTAGTVVTGMAVSFRHWTRLLTDSMRSRSGDQETGAALADGIGRIATLWADRADERLESRTQADLPTPDPSYLHLKEAAILTPNGRQEVGLWRLDVRRIDGWSLAHYPQQP